MNNRLDVKEKQNKYHNKKVYFGERKFDSIKERDRYAQLWQLELLGIIKDLKCQVKFELQPAFEKNGIKYRAITYIADFTYKQDGQLIVEDVKGYRTKEYQIKKKLFEYKYKEVIFKEV